MTYNEKKSLYESIMKEVTRQVKRSLNESYNSSIVQKLIEMTKEISKKNPKNTYCLTAMYNMYYLGYKKYSDGGIEEDTDNSLKLGEFTDDCFEGNILTGQEARTLIKLACDEKFGIVYCRKTDKTHRIFNNVLFNEDSVLTVFAIKLSDKGLEKFNEILKKFKARSDNKADDKRIESYKNNHRYELRLQQRFNKDKKKAEEIGVSVEDLLSVEFLTKRMMPEFNIHDNSEERFRKDMFEHSYIEFLKRKGIELNREHIRNTILKLLSTLKK